MTHLEAEVCWMLRLKLLQWFLFFLPSWNIFLVASSAVGGTERSWWHQKCRAAVRLLLPWEQPLDALEGQGAFTDGQGGTGGISWLCEEEKSFFIFSLEFICSEFIAFQLLEGRISCFVLFLYSVSLILLCPFVFWKWKKAEEQQVLYFISWAPAQTFSLSQCCWLSTFPREQQKWGNSGWFCCCLQGFE